MIHTISWPDFKAFVLAQPDDRKVNMGECDIKDAKCGCVMAQYAKEKIGLTEGLCVEDESLLYIYLAKCDLVTFDQSKSGFLFVRDMLGTTTYKKLKEEILKYE